jgi:hypothetical protein
MDKVKIKVSYAPTEHLMFYEAISLTSPKFIAYASSSGVPEAVLTLDSNSTVNNFPPMNLHNICSVIKRSVIWPSITSTLIYLDVSSKVAWELPHNVPFETKQFLIIQCVDRWKQPSLSRFNTVFASLSDFVERLVKTHFERFRQLKKFRCMGWLAFSQG